MPRFVLIVICLAILMTGFNLTARAATMQESLTVSKDDLTVAFVVPDTWTIQVPLSPRQAEAQSAVSAYVGGADFQKVRARLDEPAAFLYGNLPEDDRIGALMEGLKAILPYTEDYDPALMSEVYRFRWDAYPAALFVVYHQDDPLSRYVQWIGVEIELEALLLMQFETTLLPQEPPRPTVLDQFAAVRASLTVNGEPLDPAGPRVALNRVSDPYSLTGPVVAALKISGGAEVRIAAPPNWFRRNMTDNPDFPTTFFYEDDWRGIEEGEPLRGSLIQVSLISEARILIQLQQADLPSDPVSAYSTFLQTNTYEQIAVGTWVDFAWGSAPARVVGVRYPAEYAAHSGGTLQQVILVEIEGGVLMVTLYAPQNEWASALALWQTVLSSTVVNGSVLPVEPLLQALEQIVMP